MPSTETNRTESNEVFMSQIEAKLRRGWDACDIYQQGESPEANGFKVFWLIHTQDCGPVVLCRTDWKPAIPPAPGMVISRCDWMIVRHLIRSVAFREQSVDVALEPTEWKDRPAAEILQMLLAGGWYLVGIERPDRPLLANFTGEFPELYPMVFPTWNAAVDGNVAPDAVRLMAVHDIADFTSGDSDETHPCIFYSSVRKEVAATDSVQLVTVPVPGGPAEDILIPIEAIEEIRQWRREWPKEGVLVWNVDGGIMVECEGRRKQFSGKVRRFPSYKYIIPDERPSGRVTIDARYLKDICDHAIRSGDTALRVEFRDTERPLVLRGRETGVCYYLMVMKDDSREDEPETKPQPKRKR